MLYIVTFTINIPPMLAYIPYMDPMGNGFYQSKHAASTKNSNAKGLSFSDFFVGFTPAHGYLCRQWWNHPQIWKKCCSPLPAPTHRCWTPHGLSRPDIMWDPDCGGKQQSPLPYVTVHHVLIMFSSYLNILSRHYKRCCWNLGRLEAGPEASCLHSPKTPTSSGTATLNTGISL